MSEILIKEITNTDIEQELVTIGFDKTYTHKAKEKFEYKNFKLFNLKVAAANIIKQLALSVGADCGTHREVITGKQEISNCILGGSISQLKIISKKLQLQPFGLKNLGLKLNDILNKEQTHQTKIIGILNLTQNSFSDGGQFFEYDDSIKQLNKLIQDGADIIDIGAESTKPNSKPVDSQTQLDKLIPILKYIKDNNIKTPISIDTRSSEVAKTCIDLGINIINDVSGLDYDKNLVNVISEHQQVKIILQHSLGNPDNMQENPTYNNVIEDIFISLKNKVDYATKNGIKKENIIIDPGIGFGKAKEHNFEILKHWQDLRTIGCPILIGLSRKSLLNMQDSTNEEKDLYTLALNSQLIKDDIDYIRVHNVEIHKKFIELIK